MKDTLTFFNIAKPNPTQLDGATQLGCVFEEFGELLEATGWKDTLLSQSVEDAVWWQANKQSAVDDESKVDRILLLDAAADVIVTLLGYCRIHNMDLIGAFKEVEASNLSKFIFVGDMELTPQQLGEYAQLANDIEAQGRYTGVIWKRVGEYIVFYDNKGKIMKCPTTYFEPDLSKFI